jgi:hypothetical protein
VCEAMIGILAYLVVGQGVDLRHLDWVGNCPGEWVGAGWCKLGEEEGEENASVSA